MNSTPTIRAFVLSASVLALTVGSTFTQQTTGTPGSPSATTTIDGSISRLRPRRSQNNQSGCHKFQAVLAADRGAAEGRTQRLADYDR